MERGPPVVETDRDREWSRLTLHQFHAFPRLNEFNTLFRADRLFQQYMVDAAVNVEQNHLTWIRNNQNRIRADIYQ
jgi:Helitron helicase-like domain at N-terminus